MEFEWDKDKAAINQRKHQVPFEEASTVFSDPLAAIFADVDSEEEHREIIVGHSARNRIVLVCFNERGDAIRIISARRATKRERDDYEEGPQR